MPPIVSKTEFEQALREFSNLERRVAEKLEAKRELDRSLASSTFLINYLSGQIASPKNCSSTQVECK